MFKKKLYNLDSIDLNKVIAHTNKPTYKKKFHKTINGEKQTINYFSKRQLNSSSSLPIIGEISTSKKLDNSFFINTDNKLFQNMPINQNNYFKKGPNKIVGFIECSLPDNQIGYIAVIKNAIPLFTITTLLSTALIIEAYISFPYIYNLIKNFLNQSQVFNNLELDPNQKEGDGNYDSNIKSDSISISGFTEISVDSKTLSGKANISNPSANSCYFQCKIVLISTNEIVYESKMISPGKFIENITLTKYLTPGTYPAKVIYSTYDIKTMKPLNGANIKIDLKII